MVLDYHVSNNKNIVYCVLSIVDKCDSFLAKEISINTTDYVIHYAVLKGYDVIVGDSEDELLSRASDLGTYKHAVMVSMGTYLGRNDRLYHEVETLCNEEFFIAGHVLFREEKYVELHQQFYVINLDIYKTLNYPHCGEGDWHTLQPHEQFEPIIQSDDGKIIQRMTVSNNLKPYTHKLHGWNILTVALQNNKTVVDLGKGVRHTKRFLYPDIEHVFLDHYKKIFTTRLFNHTFITPWNSDTIKNDISFKGPVTQYISVGTGLNWIRNLQLLDFTDDTEIVFCDINPNCLQFMENLVTNWDGRDYDKFYKSHKQYYCDEVPEEIIRNSSTTTEFEAFTKLFDDWEEQWNSVRKLKFLYKLVDFTGEYDLSWVKPNKKTIFNISNLFNYHPLIGIQSVKYRLMCENTLIEQLKTIDPEIYLITTSRSHYGFTDEISDGCGKVNDIKTFAVTDLRRLPWHQTDWDHYKPLR